MLILVNLLLRNFTRTHCPNFGFLNKTSEIWNTVWVLKKHTMLLVLVINCARAKISQKGLSCTTMMYLTIRGISGIFNGHSVFWQRPKMSSNVRIVSCLGFGSHKHYHVVP